MECHLCVLIIRARSEHDKYIHETFSQLDSDKDSYLLIDRKTRLGVQCYFEQHFKCSTMFQMFISSLENLRKVTNFMIIYVLQMHRKLFYFIQRLVHFFRQCDSGIKVICIGMRNLQVSDHAPNVIGCPQNFHPFFVINTSTSLCRVAFQQQEKKRNSLFRERQPLTECDSFK